MKNILNNKFLLIILLACIIVFTSVSNVFAVNIHNPYTDTDINLPDFNISKNYLIVQSGSYSIITIVAFPNDFDVSNIYSASNKMYFWTKENVTTSIYKLDENNNWVFDKDYGFTSNTGFNYCTIEQAIYSTFDVYLKDGSTLVFQGAPTVPGVPEITLALAEQANKVGMTPLEIIKENLLMIVIIIISIIAIYKAISFLRKELKTS